MGEVLKLVPRVREQDRTLCFNCEHALVGPSGVFCQLWSEEIFNERIAEVCGEFKLVE